MIESKMMCPVCRTKLQSTDTMIITDVCDHQSRSNKWVCVNVDCLCSQKNACWDDDGEYYRGDMNDTKVFPDDRYAALNSFAKKMEIEVYGKGLKSKIYLSPWFTLLFLKPMIEFNYKGDEMGNVLGRTWKLKFLYKDGKFDISWIKNTNGYNTYYTSGLTMLKFVLSKFHIKLKKYKKNKTRFTKNDLYDEFEDNLWNNNWYDNVYKWYLKTFYKNLNKTLSDYMNFETLIKNQSDINFEFGRILEQNIPSDVNLLDILLSMKKKGEYVDKKIRERKLERILK